MSSQKTEHYELNQWLATDQVLRTDFNADNAKIDAAIAEKLGAIEVIQTATLEKSAGSFSMDLTGFDWSAWSIVAFLTNCGSSDVAQTVQMHMDGAAGIGYVVERPQRGAMLIALFPRRNGENQVFLLGFPVGRYACARGTGTYSQIQAARIRAESGSFDAGTTITAYGIR